MPLREILPVGGVRIRIKDRVDEKLHRKGEPMVARAERDCGREVAAGAVPAYGDLAELAERPPGRTPRVVGGRRVAMFWRAPVVNGQHRAAGPVREGAGHGVIACRVAQHPAATVKPDERGLVVTCGPVEPGGHAAAGDFLDRADLLGVAGAGQ